jgi:Tim44-like domain
MRPGAHTAACLALLLAMGCNPASAAAPGNLATSVGLLAAVMALLVTQVWPALLAAGASAPLLGFAMFAVLALVLWRLRWVPSVSSVLAFAPHSVVRPARAAAPASVAVTLPASLDRTQLLAELRRQFVRLQAAWDAREVEVLRALTTPDMLVELCTQLPDCMEAPNRTDVITLHAELLGFDDVGSAYLVSVEFSGMIRECAEGGAAPFRELWMLARPKHEGADWRLARQLELP